MVDDVLSCLGLWLVRAVFFYYHLRATTTWAPENDDFLFVSISFPSVQEKTHALKESLRSCTAIKWRSSSRTAFKKGLPTIIRFFSSFYNKRRSSNTFKKVHQGVGKKSLVVVNFVLSTRSRPPTCENECHYAHSLRSLFRLFSFGKQKPGRPRQPLSLHFDDP